MVTFEKRKVFFDHYCMYTQSVNYQYSIAALAKQQEIQMWIYIVTSTNVQRCYIHSNINLNSHNVQRCYVHSNILNFYNQGVRQHSLCRDVRSKVIQLRITKDTHSPVNNP